MHIMKTSTFRAAAEAIACLQPDPITGTVTVSQIKIALGEHLNVWPASIFDDVAGDDEEGEN